ncbi:DUF5753 domain-containing protein [Actinocorallia sp. API 0066]|uniref:DUF5753 domain-containing protein n=1 Tax=Actinocorallia sp. API 0066 TaxID=2896846 RepID=UPI001E5154A1|nr:DUF5753 domain-containing protein [Actinocorallia sp. API 0066]MCD0452502.1 DUF5753 domain-containing protein [Actinocorallia sp. API 0066]
MADRLRELRVDARLSAKSLAAAAGWERTKVSKIEHAARAPNAQDIRTWCEVCGAPEQTEDLLASLRAVEGAYVEWRRLQRTGLRQLQESRMPLFERTRLFRIYCSQVVPGLLQTPEYARALLAAIAAQHGTPDDVAEAVSARVARAKVLREGDHRFAFVMEESVLYYRMADPETMAGQLGHLLTVMSLPSVALGVIPFSSPEARPMWTLGNFSVYDTEQVRVELLTAAVTVTAPGELAEYFRAFETYAHMAVYGAEARALITRAVDALR